MGVLHPGPLSGQLACQGGQGLRLVVAGNKEHEMRVFLTLLEQQLSAHCSYSCPGGPRREGTGRNVDAGVAVRRMLARTVCRLFSCLPTSAPLILQLP